MVKGYKLATFCTNIITTLQYTIPVKLSNVLYILKSDLLFDAMMKLKNASSSVSLLSLFCMVSIDLFNKIVKSTNKC